MVSFLPVALIATEQVTKQLRRTGLQQACGTSHAIAGLEAGVTEKELFATMSIDWRQVKSFYTHLTAALPQPIDLLSGYDGMLTREIGRTDMAALLRPSPIQVVSLGAAAGQYGRELPSLLNTLKQGYPQNMSSINGGSEMQIVIDTIDPDGGCHAMIVEPIDCDGIVLLVRRNAKNLRIPLSSIVNWSPIDADELHLPLERWIKQRPEVVCF